MQVIYSICMVYRKKEKRECKRQKDEKAKDAKQLPCNDLSNMAYVYKEIVEWGAELFVTNNVSSSMPAFHASVLIFYRLFAEE